MTTNEKPDAGQGVDAAAVLVPAVTRATRVLDALVRTRSGASLTELAERCGLAKSTASNLLHAMVAEGLVSHDRETRRYNLGPILIGFGVAAIARTTAVTEARPFMEQLAERTELACLALQPIPDGHYVAIAKIESRKTIKVTIEVGERFDHTAPLVTRLATAWAAPDPADAALARVRTLGHAAVFGEYRPELNVAGFPVFDRDARPCLYIVLVGMGRDLTREDVDEMADYLVEAATSITIRSGGTVPDDFPTVDRPDALTG